MQLRDLSRRKLKHRQIYSRIAQLQNINVQYKSYLRITIIKLYENLNTELRRRKQVVMQYFCIKM